jgi:hypothetical protein
MDWDGADQDLDLIGLASVSADEVSAALQITLIAAVQNA